MSIRNRLKRVLMSLILVVMCRSALAQEDVADIRSKTFTLKSDKLQYVLIAAKGNLETPANGYKLLIVLPGGDGSSEFSPFVKRIYKHALDDGYLVVQLIAPQWNQRQQIVWPTAKDRVPGKKVAVEAFLKSAVDDVRKRTRVDASQIYTLSWSSGGPAAYAASLAKNTPVTGSFVAMSVFKPSQLPDLNAANGQRYYILHSPQDNVCPHRMAVAARDALREHGAVVQFAEYPGGHGWRGDVFGHIRSGISWLEANVKAGND